MSAKDDTVVLDDKTAHEIDKVITTRPRIRRLTRRVVRLQRQLRSRVSKAAWRTYMAIEEAVNERHVEILDEVMRRRRRARRS
jgi:hypothetical protein